MTKKGIGGIAATRWRPPEPYDAAGGYSSGLIPDRRNRRIPTRRVILPPLHERDGDSDGTHDAHDDTPHDEGNGLDDGTPHDEGNDHGDGRDGGDVCADVPPPPPPPPPTPPPTPTDGTEEACGARGGCAP